MRVICRGHNRCKDRIGCEHSKPHTLNSCSQRCFSNGKCGCIDVNIIRKNKLDQLKLVENGEVGDL